MTPEELSKWKKSWYGQFMETYKDSQKWRTGFAKKAAHQALDLPYEADDEMQVHSTKNIKSGITWKEILVAGILGLGGLALWDQLRTPPAPVNVPETESVSENDVTDTNARYMLEVDRDTEE